MTAIPDGIWLNVGSGRESPDGWVHLDGSWQTRVPRGAAFSWVFSRLTGKEMGLWPKEIRYCDVRKGLPQASGSVAVLYASHVLEHLYRSEAVAFLNDARRVLSPGGVCRVVVPDVAAIVGWYLEHKRETGHPEKSSSDLLMDMMGLRRRSGYGNGLLDRYRSWTALDQHKWMYDREGLLSLLREAGFPDPEPREYLESAIPRERLAAVEKRERIVDGAGVCAEART
jgi:SAM-dependent methyltransferase